MRSVWSALALLAVACAAPSWVAAEDISYNKVHFIDRNSTTGNTLFRSNMPLVDVNGKQEFAKDQLEQYIRERAQGEGNFTMPKRFKLHIISFLDAPDELKDLAKEYEYFLDPLHEGKFTWWPLVGNPVPPQDVPREERERILNGTDLWYVDKLPERVQQLRSWLGEEEKEPVAIVFHCEGGCDRTGEMSAAYYMTYQHMTVDQSWQRDVQDCGRDPNGASKGAQGWFCLWAEQHWGLPLGDCLHFG